MVSSNFMCFIHAIWFIRSFSYTFFTFFLSRVNTTVNKPEKAAEYNVHTAAAQKKEDVKKCMRKRTNKPNCMNKTHKIAG